MRSILMVALSLSYCLCGFAGSRDMKSEVVCDNVRVLKSGDVVIDATTASKLAEVILPTIYGNDILKQKPFKVTSDGKSWIVHGTHNGSPFTMGGVSIEIRKSDGKILSVSNSK